MFYLFVLTIFSLFIGLNNVYAADFYTTFNDSRLNYADAKAYIEEQKTYTDSSGNVYNINDYDSFIYSGVYSWYSSGNASYLSDLGFGDSIELDSTNSFNFIVTNFYGVYRPYNRFNFYESSSNISFNFPVYTKNVTTPYNVFVKFKTSMCATSNHFCDNNLGTEGDYTIVQIGEAGGELKGYLNLAEDSTKVPVDYTVNIYLDDKLESSYVGNSFAGETVTLKGLDDDKLRADDSNKYEVVLAKENNVFELRYYTSTYGTVNQQIHTDNTELPLPFSYDKLKEMFPDVNFELWTSYEQFNFVLMFNLFFILFLFFIVYILLRIFYFIKGWFF